KQGFKITLLCEVLGISRSAYYKWLQREPTKTEKRLRHLIDCIQKVYNDHKGIYGYRSITILLNHYLNVRVNHKCVYRLIRLLDLKAVIRRKRYTYKPHKPQHLSKHILKLALQKKKMK